MSLPVVAAPPELSGVRKSAVLLLSLGVEHAASVLRCLDETEVAEIMTEIAELDDVDPELVDAVISEFAGDASTFRRTLTGGAEMARHLMSRALGDERADALAERIPGAAGRRVFGFVEHVEPRLAASLLRDEHPQTVALVLANIDSGFAARLLSQLDDDVRRQVAIRIATMDRTTPDVLALVEARLEARFAALSEQIEERPVGGVQALVDLLSKSDESIERAVVESLREHDEVLADRVRAAMFSFDDLTTLDDRAIQQVLRGVDTKDLAIALKGARDAVREKILGNLSSRAGETLREEIELLGRVKVAAVEEARANVLRVVREMEENGQLVLERGSDDFVD
jgi:flagellar motor switch protein FliG